MKLECNKKCKPTRKNRKVEKKRNEKKKKKLSRQKKSTNTTPPTTMKRPKGPMLLTKRTKKEVKSITKV